MAEVYKRVNGKKVVRIVAGTIDAQDGMSRTVTPRARQARATLDRAKNRTGTSRITLEKGDTDWYVVLSDERGLAAANVIEYGRPDDTKSPWGPMEGVAPLHKSFPEMKHPGGDE